MKKEFILCAANYYDDGKQYNNGCKNIKTGFVVCGRRHSNCLFIFSKMYSIRKSLKLQYTEKQGFITNTNRWVDRFEALKIARNANQLITGNGNDTIGLFSEDLY